MKWIAPSEKDAANDTLEKRLWSAADQLRANSGLTSQQYSLPVLGLIFLRFAEVRFVKRHADFLPSPISSPSGRGTEGEGAGHGRGTEGEGAVVRRRGIHGLEGDIKQAITYYEDLHQSTGRFDFVLANSRLKKGNHDCHTN